MIIRTGDLSNAMSAKSRNQPPEEVKDKAKKADSADIKSASNSISADNALDNSPKVERIKNAVDDGSYKIDINKTADKMAQDLLLTINVFK